MTLTPNALVIFFATGKIEDAAHDDVRFSARYWDLWDVEER